MFIDCRRPTAFSYILVTVLAMFLESHALADGDISVDLHELVGKPAKDPRVTKILKFPGIRLRSEATVRTPLYARNGSKRGEKLTKTRTYESLGRSFVVAIESVTTTLRRKERQSNDRVSFLSWQRGESPDEIGFKLPFRVEVGQPVEEALAAVISHFGRLGSDARTAYGRHGCIYPLITLGGAPIQIHIHEGVVDKIEFHD